MATALNYRYPIGGPLDPGKEDWWTFGPWDSSFEGTWNFAAHPFTGVGFQYPQGISVSFMQASVDAVGRHYVNVVFENTYSTPVGGYTIWMTVIQGSD